MCNEEGAGGRRRVRASGWRVLEPWNQVTDLREGSICIGSPPARGEAHPMLHRCPIALAVTGAALLLALPAKAITYATLALEGDPAPGTGGGFTSFLAPNVRT